MFIGRVYAIALNTFREAVRNKVLYAILFFALLLTLSSLAFGELSLYESERVIKDLGLVTTTLFSALIAVYIGVSLLYKEIEKKTIYTIVSKPIERWQFLLGKYAGIILTMAVELAIMSLILALMLLLRDITLHASLAQALWLVFVEVCVIAAVALLFSAFSSPFLSGMLTGLVFIAGHLHESIRRFADGELWWNQVLLLAVHVVPDLTLFNLSRQVTYNVDVPWSDVALSTGFGAVYTAVLLLLAVVIFERRDFI